MIFVSSYFSCLLFGFFRHGYRGIDARRNLWVLPSGELLYYVAAVAVLLDREEETQRHYTGHTEDIMW
jgi:echinoderm microtubule-associated protein-like 1/2